MFQGIFAPIPTPFLDDEIAFDRLRENVAYWATTPLHGLIVGGSTGEFALLSLDERARLFDAVRRELPAAKQVIAGAGCESTRDTVALVRTAARLGADAALVVNPWYYKGEYSDAALKKFFLDVAEASSLPIILYNIPRNTGINLSAALVAELSRHPNIAGIKDSGGNIAQIAEIIATSVPGFAVLAGSGSFLLATLVLGGTGGVLALANLLPDQCASLFDLYKAGRLEEARVLQLRLLAINAAVTSGWGIPAVKAAMDMLGHYGGDPRPPLLPLGEEPRDRLRQLLAEAGALPLE